MGKKYDFSYIIIGSGPAGTAAALNLAKAKKRIAIIEGGHLGGSNINTRDIPYAVALDFAHTFARMRTYPELKNQDFTFSFPTIVARQFKTTLDVGNDYQQNLKAAGVVYFKGYANFLDQHTIAVGTQKLTAEYFILATGARPKIDGITGIDSVDFLTPNTAIKVRRLPKAVMVVGGGSTGCEIAEYFAELGSKVLIAEANNRLLPREDKEVGEVITEYFTRRLGITVLTSSKVVALEQTDKTKRVIFRTAQSEKMVRVDCIILATGSEPILDYGLENAKVKYNASGIAVNKLFQTSAKNIYAIGDCIGNDSSTERADHEGSILSTNLVNGSKTIVRYQDIPRITSTYPMVASVGTSETELIRNKRKYKKAIIKLADIPASKIYGLSHGFIKILTDKTGHVLGATIVAPNADLLIKEFAIAIRHNLSILELASSFHFHNTWDYAIKLATKKLVSKRTTLKTHKHKKQKH